MMYLNNSILMGQVHHVYSIHIIEGVETGTMGKGVGSSLGVTCRAGDLSPLP